MFYILCKQNSRGHAEQFNFGPPDNREIYTVPHHHRRIERFGHIQTSQDAGHIAAGPIVGVDTLRMLVQPSEWPNVARLRASTAVNRAA